MAHIKLLNFSVMLFNFVLSECARENETVYSLSQWLNNIQQLNLDLVALLQAHFSLARIFSMQLLNMAIAMKIFPLINIVYNE